MRHDVHTDELLSAYLAEDITPDERVTVERRLAQDSEFRERLSDLQALVALLRQGERPVTAEMLSDFKRRIERHLGAPAGRAIFAHLVSCSITGDMTDTERSVLEIYLTRHPEARNDVVSLTAMSGFLKKGERQASADTARKLAERLSAKIPAAALAPVLPQATETVKLKLLQPAAGSGQSTVRVFVAQESPWPRRLRRIAAIAALFVFSVGSVVTVRAWMRGNGGAQIAERHDGSGVNKHEALEIVQQDALSAHDLNNGQTEPANGSAVTPGAQNGDVAQGANAIEKAPAPPDIIQIPPVAPGLNAPAPSVVQSDAPKKVKAPRNQKSPAPSIAPNSPVLPNSDDKLIADERPTPTPEPKYPQQQPLDPSQGATVAIAKTNGGTTATGTAAIAPATGSGATVTPNSLSPTNPTPTPAPTNDQKPAATPLDPQNNKIIVAVIHDGFASATTPEGAKTIKALDQFSSGTDISTDGGRLALVLPGDGRLWVNKNTSFHVDLNGNNTTIQLNSGEIAYRAPLFGNLTVNHASGVQVADANGMVDIKDDPVSKTIVASAIESSLKVVRNKKVSAAKITLHKQQAASIKTDVPDQTPAVTEFANRPDEWHDDLIVPGDNPDGTPKLEITSHPAGSKNRKNK